MKYWVLGAKGMLGQAVVNALEEKVVLASSRDDADLLDLEGLHRWAEIFRPDFILNCAAYTAVDAAEDNEEAAFAVNAQGVHNLALVAQTLGCRFVHVSTDYVFDGDTKEPYEESHPPQPKGVYGRSKLAGEDAVRDLLGDRAIIIRTSWLFGPGGPNFVQTMVRLMLNKKQLGVISDQVGRPTYTHDLADAMIFLAENSEASGIFHFANQGAVSWHGFAQVILKLVGSDAQCLQLNALKTHEYPTRARRPAYSVFDTTKISSHIQPRHWGIPLVGYVADLVKQLKENPL